MDTRIRLLAWALALSPFGAAAAFAQKPVPVAPPSAQSTAATPQKSPAPASQYAAEANVIERIRVGLRYENDGSSQEVQYLRVRIQAQPAIQAWGQLVFSYNAATDRIHVDFVRVHKPGGRVVVAGPDAIQDLSSPVARIAPVYTDLRQIHVTVPDLGIGDTLEYQVTTQTIHPLIPGQFFLEWNFMKQIITLDETLAVNLPRGRAIKVKTSNGASPPTIQLEGDRRVYTWHSSFTQRPDDSGGQSAKNNKPKPLQFPDVAISTFDNWAQVGAWYAALERPRAAVTDSIRAEAATLVKGQTTDLGKVKAIYDYVSESIRYVGLSFGIGQYQPHPAAEVLANQYGDCKDKATLFQSLLAAEGIDSYPVLINADSKVDPDVPSPGQFDHLINVVVVDGKSYWADTTPGVTPLGFLLQPLRDTWALAIPPSGAPALVRTPENPPFMPEQAIDVNGKVDTAGELQGTFSYSATGDFAVILRAALQMVPQAYWSRLAKALVGQAVGHASTVSSYHFTEPADLSLPIQLSAQFSDADFVNMTRKDVSLALPTGGVDLPQVDEPAAGSTAPLRLGVIRGETVNWKIAMPANLAASLPVPVHVSRDYAEYQSTYSVAGATVTASRHLVIRNAKITAADYDGLQAFHSAVTADEGQKLSFTNSAPEFGAAPAGLSATDLLQQGYSAYQARNYAEAERLYKAAAAKDPSTPGLWNDLGLVYNALGEYAKAVPALEKAIKDNPYDPYAYNNLGQAERGLGDDDAAITDYQKQIAINPLDHYAHTNLGQIYLSEKKYALAQTEFQTALKITPNALMLYVSLGSADLGLHQDQAALAAFRKVLARIPFPPMWSNIAYELASHRSYLDKAQQYAENAIHASEAQSEAISLDNIGFAQTGVTVELPYEWDVMGWVRFQQGDPKAAERYVHSSWILADVGRTGDHLGQIYEKEGKRADAIRAYELALHCPKPPAETRDRLAALIGKQAAAHSPAPGHGLAARRTANLKNPQQLSGTAEFWILLAPSAKPSPSGSFPARVADARFISGDAALRSSTGAIRAAHLPYSFPTGEPAKLLLRAVFSCSKLTRSCMLVPFGVQTTANRFLPTSPVAPAP